VEETRQLPGQGSERQLLQGQLDSLRQTLIRKADGLDRVVASRRLVPSQTTLLGIMKHSTDTEEWWFRVTMNGENILLTYHTPEDEYVDWRIEPRDTVESVVAAYRAACTHADQAIAPYSLDDITRGRGYEQTLRWVYLHMIEELARHCGHADILRESTDGAAGE
jgi:Protein of unknown function (DUF664)